MCAKSKIRLLKAEHGDSFIIETDNEGIPFVMVVDGGTDNAYENDIEEKLEELSQIDLMVLTHTDNDHIEGLLSFISSTKHRNIPIKKYWINCMHSIRVASSAKVSFSNGASFEKELKKREGEEASCKWSEDIYYPNSFQYKKIKIVVLSPTKEVLEQFYDAWKISEIEKVSKVSSGTRSQIQKGDLKTLSQKEIKQKPIKNDITNASSIAFILILPDISILMLGDSRPEIIVKSLEDIGYSKEKKLEVDYVKVSHHGSKYNTTPELMEMIKCDNYIIMTNGGFANSKHPDRETIAKILWNRGRDMNREIKLIFNYKLSDIEKTSGVFITDEEIKESKCKIIDDCDEL